MKNRVSPDDLVRRATGGKSLDKDRMLRPSMTYHGILVPAGQRVICEAKEGPWDSDSFRASVLASTSG